MLFKKYSSPQNVCSPTHHWFSRTWGQSSDTFTGFLLCWYQWSKSHLQPKVVMFTSKWIKSLLIYYSCRYQCSEWLRYIPFYVINFLWWHLKTVFQSPALWSTDSLSFCGWHHVLLSSFLLYCLNAENGTFFQVTLKSNHHKSKSNKKQFKNRFLDVLGNRQFCMASTWTQGWFIIHLTVVNIHGFCMLN